MECFFTGTSQYPARCMKEIHNAASLMNATNSATGELSYYGRWELDPKNMESNPTDPYQSTKSVVPWCTKFAVTWNSATTSKCNTWCDEPSTPPISPWTSKVDCRTKSQASEIRKRWNCAASFRTYSTGSSVPFRQNNTFARPKGPLANPDSSVANAYAAHYNAPYDPPYPTPPSPNVNVYNAPPDEGSIILNPFVTDNRNNGVLSNNYNIYRKIPGLVFPMIPHWKKTWWARPFTKLPLRRRLNPRVFRIHWPNSGGGHGFNTDPVDNPQQRYGDFNCWNVNEQHWALHQTPLGSIVNGWKYYSRPQSYPPLH